MGKSILYCLIIFSITGYAYADGADLGEVEITNRGLSNALTKAIKSPHLKEILERTIIIESGHKFLDTESPKEEIDRRIESDDKIREERAKRKAEEDEAEAKRKEYAEKNRKYYEERASIWEEKKETRAEQAKDQGWIGSIFSAISHGIEDTAVRASEMAVDTASSIKKGVSYGTESVSSAALYPVSKAQDIGNATYKFKEGLKPAINLFSNFGGVNNIRIEDIQLDEVSMGECKNLECEVVLGVKKLKTQFDIESLTYETPTPMADISIADRPTPVPTVHFVGKDLSLNIEPKDESSSGAIKIKLKMKLTANENGELRPKLDINTGSLVIDRDSLISFGIKGKEKIDGPDDILFSEYGHLFGKNIDFFNTFVQGAQFANNVLLPANPQTGIIDPGHKVRVGLKNAIIAGMNTELYGLRQLRSMQFGPEPPVKKVEDSITSSLKELATNGSSIGSDIDLSISDQMLIASINRGNLWETADVPYYGSIEKKVKRELDALLDSYDKGEFNTQMDSDEKAKKSAKVTETLKRSIKDVGFQYLDESNSLEDLEKIQKIVKIAQCEKKQKTKEYKKICKSIKKIESKLITNIVNYLNDPAERGYDEIFTLLKNEVIRPHERPRENKLFEKFKKFIKKNKFIREKLITPRDDAKKIKVFRKFKKTLKKKKFFSLFNIAASDLDLKNLKDRKDKLNKFCESREFKRIKKVKAICVEISKNFDDTIKKIEAKRKKKKGKKGTIFNPYLVTKFSVTPDKNLKAHLSLKGLRSEDSFNLNSVLEELKDTLTRIDVPDLSNASGRIPTSVRGENNERISSLTTSSSSSQSGTIPSLTRSSVSSSSSSGDSSRVSIKSLRGKVDHKQLAKLNRKIRYLSTNFDKIIDSGSSGQLLEYFDLDSSVMNEIIDIKNFCEKVILDGKGKLGSSSSSQGSTTQTSLSSEESTKSKSSFLDKLKRKGRKLLVPVYHQCVKLHQTISNFEEDLNNQEKNRKSRKEKLLGEIKEILSSHKYVDEISTEKKAYFEMVCNVSEKHDLDKLEDEIKSLKYDMTYSIRLGAVNNLVQRLLEKNKYKFTVYQKDKKNNIGKLVTLTINDRRPPQLVPLGGNRFSLDIDDIYIKYAGPEIPVIRAKASLEFSFQTCPNNKRSLCLIPALNIKEAFGGPSPGLVKLVDDKILGLVKYTDDLINSDDYLGGLEIIKFDKSEEAEDDGTPSAAINKAVDTATGGIVIQEVDYNKERRRIQINIADQNNE